MMSYETSIDIDAPPSVVWKVMSRVERWPEWTPSIRSVRPLGGGPLTVGTRVLIRQPRLPPALWRVTELEAERGFTWVSRAPGVEVVAGHWIEPVEGGCRVTLSIGHAGFFGGLVRGLTRDLTERYVHLEAEGLKRESERSV